MKLIIVESPTKSQTLKKFLGSEYQIVASMGHVRDLPKSKLGIDEKDNFKPEYVVVPKAKKTIKEIKELAQKAEKVFLATDPDREGEAISWHLSQALGLKNYQRIVFHEITSEAIKNSLKNPQEINMGLVNSQQARRILDRIVGYKLSPLLWRKVLIGLSAGRVQSAAVRLVAQREEERNSFKIKEYWTIEAEFSPTDKTFAFPAKLSKINNKTLDKLAIENESQAQQIIKELKDETYQVIKVENKETKKNPLPPFITSTLQQEAYKKLGFSAKNTMRIAQQLYEKGLTTYHRTDSLNLSSQSLDKAQKFILEKYGKEYWKKNIYKTKSKSAQEAHEAIRPADPFVVPSQTLEKSLFRLYNLIWQRFLASQMTPAIFNSSTVEIETKKSNKFIFRASGQTLLFDGFLKVYPIKFSENNLPELEKDNYVNLLKLGGLKHFTQPPARYTEASLIKDLEEHSIGRPSTYAPILSTIQDRGYVKKDEERRFYPEQIGIIVNNLLVNHFPEIVDVDFTAKMEKDLDEIAENKKKWESLISDFYFPFEKKLKEKEKEINKKDIMEKKIDEKCEKCGSGMVLKMGRFGEFIACSNYPDCKNTRQPESEEIPEKKCDKCGGDMKMKRSRFGAFLGCSNYPECKNIEKIEKKIGLKCPDCKTGDVIEKKSKRGKTFYGCNRYPDCTFISNKKPSATSSKKKS